MPTLGAAVPYPAWVSHTCSGCGATAPDSLMAEVASPVLHLSSSPGTGVQHKPSLTPLLPFSGSVGYPWQGPALAGRSSREQDGALHPYTRKDSSKACETKVKTLTGEFLEAVVSLRVSGKAPGAPNALSLLTRGTVLK